MLRSKRSKKIPSDQQTRNENPTHGDPISHPPAEAAVSPNVRKEDLQQPTVAAGVVVSEIISFGDTAERLLEVLLVVLVGICLAAHWDSRAIPLALVFFLVVRPVLTQLFLLSTRTNITQRWLMSWFGIKGIGSLYYLTYALNHGLQTQTNEVIGITISVVAISILLHGTTSQPILDYYERIISEENASQ